MGATEAAGGSAGSPEDEEGGVTRVVAFEAEWAARISGETAGGPTIGGLRTSGDGRVIRMLSTEGGQRHKRWRKSGSDQQEGVFLCLSADGALRESD
eukprot:2692305-Pleurochrysis_carterae.AAC.1